MWIHLRDISTQKENNLMVYLSFSQVTLSIVTIQFSSSPSACCTSRFTSISEPLHDQLTVEDPSECMLLGLPSRGTRVRAALSKCGMADLVHLMYGS